MPAGLSGSTPVQNAANPSLGNATIFDLLSGPKGSPKDFDLTVPYLGQPGIAAGLTASGNQSTGGLSTGIGFGTPPVFGPGTAFVPGTLVGFANGSFVDDYTPGVTMPDGTASANSKLMYIGGGKSNADGTPVIGGGYTAGFGIGMAGNGASRDAGAGPAFTGFPLKTVTATGSVANGAAVETNWQNRSNVTLATGQSVFGSGTVASAAVA
jgi:hypothetical protein